MNVQLDLIPAQNLEAYAYLYRTENALRELIVETLAAADGPKWYKRRLPPDVLRQYRDGISAQRRATWTRLTLHHPVYFLDFTHLKKTIEAGGNWEHFRSIFERKDILTAELSEIEEVRNSIAHCRKITDHDLHILRSTHDKIAEAIGPMRFKELVERSTCAMAIGDKFSELLAEGLTASAAVKKLQPIETLACWNAACDQWWFDESYLDRDLQPVRDFFSVIQEATRH
jgi:hypothetical protein